MSCHVPENRKVNRSIYEGDSKMHKGIILSLIALLSLGVAAASADVFVLATIDKDKDKFVFEDIEKFKLVNLLIFVNEIVDNAAESEALVNQRNEFNETFAIKIGAGAGPS